MSDLTAIIWKTIRRRMEEIEARLELIRNLKRKYGKNISEILSYLEKSEKELAGISLSSERREQLEQERVSSKKRDGAIGLRAFQGTLPGCRKINN